MVPARTKGVVVHLLIAYSLDKRSKSLLTIINMRFPHWHSEEV